MTNEIRIYVACLAAYNNGRLHGKWIDATQALVDIQDEVNAMLEASPEPDAEEWAIHDYEGFEGYRVSKYEGFESVHEIACFIEEYEGLAGELLNHFGGCLDDARKAIEDNYSGCYESVADYAEQLTSETSEVPEHLQFYIDYEKMGRDIELNGDIYTIETAYQEVHVFWNH